MTLVEIENQDYRRDILSLLHGDGDYAMNEVTLISSLRLLGNPIARDRLKTQLHWLKDQGMLTLKDVGESGLVTARLTQNGVDVAQGLSIVPGIARIPL